MAVIGKEFSLSLLKQVVERSEDDLQPMLAHLQAAEFIYEQPHRHRGLDPHKHTQSGVEISPVPTLSEILDQILKQTT